MGPQQVACDWLPRPCLVKWAEYISMWEQPCKCFGKWAEYINMWDELEVVCMPQELELSSTKMTILKFLETQNTTRMKIWQNILLIHLTDVANTYGDDFHYLWHYNTYSHKYSVKYIIYNIPLTLQ